MQSAERVWRGLLDAGMTRADHVVALGGGVVGDLAGFCAATYQRGVPVVQIPTTLLAQVDSAYGGKTGVDLPEAKNYVGAYHQPAGVLVDPDTLASLPAAELAAGWVEVLKTALIAGGALWERVSGGERGRRANDPRLRAHEARGRGRGRARRRAAPAAEPRAHDRPRDRDRDRLQPATATARRSGWGCSPRCACRGSTSLRAQVRELLLARGLPVTLEGVTADEVVGGDRARQEARRDRACRSCSCRAPGEREDRLRGRRR